MSKGVNKVILIGNVGGLPEQKHINSTIITKLSVATSDVWKDKVTGEKKESTEWHKVNIFGELGNIAMQYVKKGSKVYIEGKIHTQKWNDKQTGEERTSVNILAHVLQILDGKPKSEVTPYAKEMDTEGY